MSTERIFNFGDAQLLSFGGVVSKNLTNDLHAFKAFDSTFADDYPHIISVAIEDVMSIRTDNVVIDEMTELTETVNETLSQCNVTFKTIRFFVKKVFADKMPVQNQFGLNDIDKVRKNVPKMIVFMKDLDGMVQKYKSELIEGGCSEAVLDSVKPLGEKLSADNVNQEQFKKQRGVITSNRVEKLNQLYSILKPVNDIARIIYTDSQEQLVKYTFPRPKSSNNGDDDLVVS